LTDEQGHSIYYTSRKPKLLKEFRAWAKHIRKVMAPRYGAEFTSAVLEDARQAFEALIPQMPYIGGEANFLTRNLAGPTITLALYRALQPRGIPVDDTGEIAYRAFESRLRSTSRLKLRLWGWMAFTGISKRAMKAQAETSQERRYPGDFGYAWVEGDGVEFDYGLDFTECAVLKFYRAQGAAELTPYLCLSDFPYSQATGTGLVRTTTLAEGADCCDFRYKRGREVTQGWPPGLPQQERKP
jgi:hypothetical protein